MPVQKQTRAGQRTRFKAFVAMGDYSGHVGLGVKCSKEVATAIRGAIILAKLSIIPVRLGYWGNKIGTPHTVPCKVGEWIPLCSMMSCCGLSSLSPSGYWQVWFCVGEADSSPAWDRDRQCSSPKEAAADGRSV